MISQTGGAAAFFDLDGTLAPLPSLEWRLSRSLRKQGLVPRENYLAWLGATLRLFATRGASAARHENKLYLRGLSARDLALFKRLKAQFSATLPTAIRTEDDLDHLCWWGWASRGAGDAALMAEITARFQGFDTALPTVVNPGLLGHLCRLLAHANEW